jgi:hypothetical protein
LRFRDVWIVVTGAEVENHERSFLVVAVILTCLVLIETADAKGPFDRLMIYGQGKSLSLTEPQLLSFDAFADFRQPYPGSPMLVTEGFLVVRGSPNPEAGEWTAFDSLRVYPSADGEAGFVYYRLKPQAGVMLLAAFAEATPAADRPASVPSAGLVGVGALAAAFLVGLAVGRSSGGRKERQVART